MKRSATYVLATLIVAGSVAATHSEGIASFALAFGSALLMLALIGYWASKLT